MEDLVFDSIAYLHSKEQTDYLAYIFTAIDELFNKKVAQIIKKDDLNKINRLLRANWSTRFIILPIYGQFLTENTLDSFKEYYEQEKDALVSLKKYIKTTQEEKIITPKYSYSGIIINAIAVTSFENISKVNKIVKLSTRSSYSGFNVTLPQEMTIASNPELIKKIGTINQNKKNS